MGGIDVFDSYIALYRTKLKSTKKYYLKIYFHTLNMMVINCWHSSTPRKSLRKLGDFEYQIAQTLYRFQTRLKLSRLSRVSANILEKKRRVQLRSYHPMMYAGMEQTIFLAQVAAVVQKSRMLWNS